MPGVGVIGPVVPLDDCGVQAVGVSQLGELPPLVGLDFEDGPQWPAGGVDEWYVRELDRVLRPSGGGAGEDSADAEAPWEPRWEPTTPGTRR
jgi:hypothetical protein